MVRPSSTGGAGHLCPNLHASVSSCRLIFPYTPYLVFVLYLLIFSPSGVFHGRGRGLDPFSNIKMDQAYRGAFLWGKARTSHPFNRSRLAHSWSQIFPWFLLLYPDPPLFSRQTSPQQGEQKGIWAWSLWRACLLPIPLTVEVWHPYFQIVLSFSEAKLPEQPWLLSIPCIISIFTLASQTIIIFFLPGFYRNSSWGNVGEGKHLANCCKNESKLATVVALLVSGAPYCLSGIQGSLAFRLKINFIINVISGFGRQKECILFSMTN